MRQVFLDTETTGINPRDNHRIVEVAAVEVVDGHPTGRVFHALINPDRDVPPETVRVHGHTWESLKDKPRFRDIAPDLLAFIDGAEVLAHNSGFDEDHLNAELVRMSHPKSIWEIAQFTDTLELARRTDPKLKSHKLDALLDEYGIDRSARTVHTALLDTHLLVSLYAKIYERHGEQLNRPSLESDVPRAPIQFLTRPTGLSLRILRASDFEASLHETYLDGLESETKQPPLARRPPSPASAPTAHAPRP